MWINPLYLLSYLRKLYILLSFCYHKRLPGHSPGNRFSILFVILFRSFIFPGNRPETLRFRGILRLDTMYLTVLYIYKFVLINAYSMMEATRPDPTVRPPSRIAKVRPCSIAIGWISSIVISTLSPGMHISVPSGRLITPVTSVVLK